MAKLRVSKGASIHARCGLRLLLSAICICGAGTAKAHSSGIKAHCLKLSLNSLIRLSPVLLWGAPPCPGSASRSISVQVYRRAVLQVVWTVREHRDRHDCSGEPLGSA